MRSRIFFAVALLFGCMSLSGCASPAGAQDQTDEEGASCAMPPDVPDQAGALNVLGEPLEVCGTEPQTGFFRSGRCETGPQDRGVHVVCAEVTQAFLEYSRERGNDLIRARPSYGFPGLEQGDRWCLCADRWREAEEAGVAPPVVLEATHEAAVRIVQRERLVRRAMSPSTTAAQP